MISAPTRSATTASRTRALRRDRTDLLLLAAAFAGGLLVRTLVLGWGLPYVGHVDEPALAEVITGMVITGDPNPHIFRYPSLFYSLAALAVRLHLWLGVQQGVYASAADLPVDTYGYTSAPGAYLAMRAVTAVSGAVTVAAIYALGRAMFGRRTGILAALTLMVAHFHVRHSYYVTTDVPTGLWVALAVLAAWYIADDGRWRWYLLGGAAVGLATGTKYNAAVCALALVIGHAMRWRRASAGRPAARLCAAGALAVLVFVATTPFALLDWRTFLADLQFNATHYTTGEHDAFGGRWRLDGYADFLWERGLFPPGALLTLAGLPLLLRRAPRQTALLLAVSAALYLWLMSYAVNFARNTLPVLPLQLLLAAAATVALADLLPRPVLRWAALLALSAALVLPHATRTAQLLVYWSRPHTLVHAVQLLHELPHGMRFAAEVHPHQLGDDPYALPVDRVTDYPLAWYHANGIRYLVVNDDRRTPETQAAYQALLASAEVVARLPSREENVQTGPGGAILDLGEHIEAIPFARRELRFGEQAALLGYELRPDAPRFKVLGLGGAAEVSAPRGSVVLLNLYWRALAPIDRDYALFIHVLDERGERVWQRDLPPRHADYPPSRWRPGELVVDSADLDLSALPPGVYRLDVGLYDAATGVVLPVHAPSSAPGEERMLLHISIGT